MTMGIFGVRKWAFCLLNKKPLREERIRSPQGPGTMGTPNIYIGKNLSGL